MNLISVIIPTYNRAHLIRRAVESVLHQTYTPLEILIIDDGSTDTTAEVLKQYPSTPEKQLKYHYQPNGGCSSARNTGIQLAIGQFITFLDSDDEWVPTALATLFQTLTSSPADFVYSPSIEILPTGRETINYPTAAEQPTQLAEKHFFHSHVRNGSTLFRRSVFDRVGLLNTTLRYNEDSDFLQRVAITCPAAYSPTPTVRVYHHATNKSQNRVEIFKALLKSNEAILKNYPEFAQKLGPKAQERLNTLKLAIIRHHILQKQFAATTEWLNQLPTPLPWDITYALSWQQPFIVKYAELLRGYSRKLLSKIKPT